MTLTPDFSKDAVKRPIEYSDLETYLKVQDQSKNQYISKLYKNYYMYRMDRASDLYKTKETWRTNVKFPITSMFVTRIYNLILKSDLFFVAIDKFAKERGEDMKGIQDEVLYMLSYLWEKEETKDSFFSAILDAILIGRGLFDISYRSNSYMKPYLDAKGNKKEREVVHEYPYLSYKSAYNTYFDPGAKTLNRSRFIIDRKLLVPNECKRYLSKWGVALKEAEIKEKNHFISYQDFEAQKFNMPFFNLEQDWSQYSAGGPRDITEDDQYNIKDKFLEVITVETPMYVTIYVGGVDHGTHPTIGPMEGYKTKIINYKKNPGTMYSLGVGYQCRPIQEVYDTLVNMRIDNVKLTVNKAFMYESGLNIAGNDTRIKLAPGKGFKVNSMDQIREIQISEVKESAYREADFMFGIVQAMTGVTSSALGLQTKVERVAGGAELLQNALDDQLLPLLESISDAMADVAREFIVLTLTYMPEEEIDKILGPDNKFKNLDVDDLINDYIFDFKISSQWSKIGAAERQQLLTLVQLVANIQDSAGVPVADLRKLIDKVIESFSFGEDFTLDGDEYTKQLQDRLLAEQAAQQPPENSVKLSGGGASRELDIAEQDTNAMRQLQQLGGAGIPPEQTTNAQGTNI